MKTGKIKYLVTLALLVALMLVFGFLPVGMINVGVVYVTLLCLPVLIGTLTLGLKAGMILTLCFGTISFLTALLKGASASVQLIMSRSVFYVALLCYLPRLLIPVVAWFVYKGLRVKNEKLALMLGALLGSLTNTVLYLGSIIVLYLSLQIDSAAFLSALGSVVLFAGIPEAVVAMIVSMPVVTALQKAKLAPAYDANK